jgi:hypothetical protein
LAGAEAERDAPRTVRRERVQRGAKDTVKQAAEDTWLGALRNLPDNPIYTHMRLALRRRARRGNWLRRNALVLILLPCALVLDWLLAGPLLGASTPAWQTLVLEPALGLYLFSLTCLIVALGWAAQGLYTAIVDVLGILGKEERRSGLVRLDDCLATTRLTDRGIVIGALGVLVPPLAGRVLLCAPIFAACLALGSYGAETKSIGLPPFDPSQVQAGTYHAAAAVVSLPLTLSVLVVSGVMAITVILSALLALGRGLPAIAAGASAFIVVLAEWLYGASMYGIGPAMHGLTTEFFSTVGVHAGVLFLLTVLAPAVALYSLISLFLSLGHVSYGSRAVAAIATPFVLVILPYLGMFFWLLQSDAFGVYSPVVQGIACYFLDLGVLSAFNPQVLPSPYCWGASTDAQYAWADLCRVLILLLLQAALIPLCLHYARLAVAARRQEA